jgi:hypothetical protein
MLQDMTKCLEVTGVQEVPKDPIPVDELYLRCLELTKNDAYTRNAKMWCETASVMFDCIKKKMDEEYAKMPSLVQKPLGETANPANPAKKS